MTVAAVTVEKAADVLEAFIASHQSEPASDAPSETPVSADEIKRLKGLGFLNNKGTNRFNARVVTGNGRITTPRRDVLQMLQPFTAAARSP